MKTFKPKAAHEDERGSITDVLTCEAIDFVTRIEIKEGAIRGNHYHEQTIQYIYVLDGSIVYRTRTTSGEVIDTTLRSGDMILTEPYEAHAMQALSDASFMVFTRGPRGGENYETDTVRLEVPLL